MSVQIATAQPTHAEEGYQILGVDLLFARHSVAEPPKLAMDLVPQAASRCALNRHIEGYEKSREDLGGGPEAGGGVQLLAGKGRIQLMVGVDGEKLRLAVLVLVGEIVHRPR